MKNIIVFGVVIAVFVFAVVTFLDFRNKGKYEECTKSCKDNRTCTEIGKDLGVFGAGCAKYNDGDCLNTCVQKYK